MKNKIFNLLFLLIIIFSFTGCFGLKFKPYSRTYVYTEMIYGILKNGKVDRMNIPENDIDKMRLLFSQKYGIRFHNEYNTVVAPKMYNKHYDINTEFGKKQYIKFYDNIKVTIGEKTFIIPKEKIVLNEIEKGAIFYEYSVPIDIINSSYNDVIVDLGTVEIYDETGKIQRPKRKIPPVLIKKTYLILRYNNIMQTSQDTLYRGWAENCPIELQKQK